MKNGLENFSFLILEIVPKIATNNYLLTRENFYIKKYSPEYNVIQDAINTYGWHHTEETRIKISLNYSEERKIMIGNFNKDKNLKESTKKKLSDIAKNRPIISLDTRLKCITKSHPIAIYDIQENTIDYYSSIKDGAKAINCNEKTIHRVLNSEDQIYKKKFNVVDIFKYVILNIYIKK